MWRTSRTRRLDRLVVFRWLEGRYAPAGELTFEGAGRTRSGRYVYARSYLATPDAEPIDPVGLPLRGRSVPAAPEEVPLAFHDSGPDGWGKEVLTQAFPTTTLSMPEYLALGGLDRTGDLAFGPTPEDGPQTWRPDETPLLDLPGKTDDLGALMDAAAAAEAGTADRHHFRLLFRQSADVGGARPKARIRADERQWIAKFPAAMDTFDEPRVEAACLDAAAAAGLPVPARRIVVVGGRAALLTERFDREGETDAPLSYLSAATLLGQPSTRYGTRKTYLDIAEIARRIGVRSAAEGMFRRLLVNSGLHNTDDHLRNHAFIRRGREWQISPVFDVLPHPGRARHACAPAPGISPTWGVDAAFAAHAAFRIAAGEASAIRDHVGEALRRLPEFLDARGVSRRDRERLRASLPPGSAFDA